MDEDAHPELSQTFNEHDGAQVVKDLGVFVRLRDRAKQFPMPVVWDQMIAVIVGMDLQDGGSRPLFDVGER